MNFPLDNNLSPEDMHQRMRILQYKVHEKKIEEAWKNLVENEFEPILIKGWAAAQYYPEPYERVFTDIDLMIDPEEFERAEIFLRNNPQNCVIDLHCGARHHDTLPFNGILSECEKIACGSAEIIVPRIEDHLRILCVHWLTDGGAYREKLWDIYYAVSNRPVDFDWERLLNTVGPTRRRWIICTIGLAHKHLGLRIDDTPISEEAKNIPGWIEKTIEKEWKSRVKLMPIPRFDYNKKEFFEQIFKRLLPNPIHATVDCEGEFDEKIRFFYQIKNFVRRLRPIFKRFYENR